MTLYGSTLALKLLCALTYVGAVVAAFTTPSAALRARAVHRVASPALFATWLLGGSLAALRGTPLGRPWIVGGFALSVLSLLTLIYCTTRAPAHRMGLWACLAPIALTVGLMVMRPGSSRALGGSSVMRSSAAGAASASTAGASP